MSRSTVVRRLTAVLALLAILCMAAPAVAATPSSHHARSPEALHITLLDQFLSWLGIGPVPTGRSQAGSMEKSTGATIPPAFSGQNVGSTDASYGLDPNGHS
ncbi:MAG TPA: hypothetical protein VGG20_25470 [Thermoanaerobaculia bacterium]